MENKKITNLKIDESVTEFIRSIVIAVVLAVVFRSFLFEPFYIPSGSMKSTLLIGDYVFVSKYSYGYSRYSFPFGFPLVENRIFDKKPERGDVIVFKLPSDNETNYIKRLIGMPGDTVQVKDSRLYINGEIVPRKRVDNFVSEDDDGHNIEMPQYIETLPNGVSYRTLDHYRNGDLDNTDVFTVPEGHYFMMGDNRDHSADSRTVGVGYVPEKNLLGPAEIIFFSNKSSILKPWEWIIDFRIDRFLSYIKYKEND